MPSSAIPVMWEATSRTDILSSCNASYTAEERMVPKKRYAIRAALRSRSPPADPLFHDEIENFFLAFEMV